MVKLTKIYTRGGDQGKTSLGDGSRCFKHDIRVEAYGTVDEVNAVIGLARLHAEEEIDVILARIQNDLFDLGADLCVPQGSKNSALRVVAAQTTRLEKDIDAYNAQLHPLESFVLPGGTVLAAHLHVARSVCRRAERLVTALIAQASPQASLVSNEAINPEIVRYLNRLSDLFFVLARVANHNGQDDVLWVPGKNREL